MTAAYRRIADGLVARILSGELPPGSRLPEPAELEALHGAASTQAAIAWLVANRWVVRSPGLGLHVAGQLPQRPAPPARPPAGSPAPAGPVAPADLPSGLDLAQLARDVEELKRWRAEHEQLHDTCHLPGNS